jgi:hypothetical protein
MAFTFTVTNVHSEGNLKSVHGTFTSAAGDSSGTLGNSVHGLNYIVDYNITTDTGGVNTENPKVTVSSGEITFVFNDTEGYSGKFYVKGR